MQILTNYAYPVITLLIYMFCLVFIARYIYLSILMSFKK